MSELASTVASVLHSNIPMLRTMGMEVLEARPGHVRTRLPFLPENGNHIGTVYAGALFSLLESSGGALVFVSFDITRWIPVVVEGTIRYVRPVKGAVETTLSLSQDEIDAVHAMLEADPKSPWTLSSVATAEDGRTICEADFVYRFRSAG